MNPAIVVAIAFFNVLIGTFSKQKTMGIWFTVIAIVVAVYAYEYRMIHPGRWCRIVGMPCGSAQQMAITWGLMASLPMWFVTWLGKITASLT